MSQSPPPSSPVSVRGRLILVMGPTGVGKSTFINTATGQDRCTIHHGLKSSTSGVTFIEISGPDGRPIVFVDTPGLDDTGRADIEILGLIMEWLVATYKRGIKLAGILYLHRMNAPRITESIKKNFNVFSSISDGPEMPHAVLVTTFWGGEVPPEIGRQREAELKETNWKDMLVNGCKTMRFTLTDKEGRKSAWDIINHLLSKDPTHIADVSHHSDAMVDDWELLNEDIPGLVQTNELKKHITDRRQESERLRKLVGQPHNRSADDILETEITKIETGIFFAKIQLHILRIPFLKRLYNRFFGHSQPRRN